MNYRTLKGAVSFSKTADVAFLLHLKGEVPCRFLRMDMFKLEYAMWFERVKIQMDDGGPSKAACKLSYKHFEEILDMLVGGGYEFITFEDFDPDAAGEPFVLMRHDVDCYPNKALDLARMEAERGIVATYFIRLHSRNYNPFGYPEYDALTKIKELGHRLALHTEFYDMARIFGGDPYDYYRREKEVLEQILGVKSRVFAPHRTPGATGFQEIMKWLDKLKDRTDDVHTYEPRFKDGIRYISDSYGAWREGCPCSHIGREKRLHLLIHPTWWYRDHIELEEAMG